MFSKEDGYRDVVMSAVVVTMASGAVLAGLIERPRTKPLKHYLNDATMFIEIELYDGTILQLSKASIETCELRDVPKAEQLALSIRKADVFHPFGTLGLEQTATPEIVREAYRKRIAQYHPDKYAGLDLPPEIVAYISDMMKRVNVAYVDALRLIESRTRQEQAPAPRGPARRAS